MAIGQRLKTGVGVARLAGPFFAFRALRHVLSIETLVRWAWQTPVCTHRRDATEEQRVAARVRKLMRLSGDPDDQCLARSLVLYRALSRMCADPQLVIGFKREFGAPVGHAWVVVDGQPVDEPRELIATLAPTCAYGRRGVVARTVSVSSDALDRVGDAEPPRLP